MRKKILIDANSLIRRYTSGYLYGVGRSTYELLSAISKIEDLPFDLEIFFQNTRGVNSKGDLQIPTRHFYIPNRVIFKKLSSLFRLKKLSTHYDLLHIPHNTEISEDISRTIFTIHDLIVYKYPEMWGIQEQDYKNFEKVAKGCKHIITCSQSSKDDIVKYWNIPESKVSVIHWGVNRDVFKHIDDIEILKKYRIGPKFIFCSSCNHPRKNTPIILEAFSNYLHRGGQSQLVLLGPLDTDIQPYKDLLDQNKIVICRFIPDYDLNVLYSMSHFTIMASKYEGFGFPILESLACGTQVVCAQNSSLCEVGGDVVLYLAPFNSKNLCDKMIELDSVDKRSFTDPSIIDGHLNSFRWDNCAKEYVKLYAELLADI